ncbi:MAG: glycerol-3-phosphate 1-O-acyltransferase PlsY [Betaproteobacteria bacterium]
MAVLLFCVAGYLAGSVSFAVVVSRLMGLPDPHDYGSGNPGATNVLRSGSKLAAGLTLVGDSLKGFVVMMAGRWVGPPFGFEAPDLALAGFCAFLGHLYPVFFRFRGGKGVSTAAGVLFGLSGWLGLSVLGVWGLAVGATRISSLGALSAAVSAPVLALVFTEGWKIFAIVFAMAALLIWRHRANIRRLLDGTERPPSR